MIRLRLPRFWQTAVGKNAVKTDQELAYARACGLRPGELVQVRIGDLRFQYRHEFHSALERFLAAPDGRTSWKLVDSPHVLLLQLYESKGTDYLGRNFRETQYYGMFSEFHRVGYAIDWGTGQRQPTRFDENHIRRRIEKFIRLFESIKRGGYLTPPHHCRHVLALEAPYEVLRFKRPIDPSPYEIWSGHHRSAVLHMLRHDEIQIRLLHWDPDGIARVGGEKPS